MFQDPNDQNFVSNKTISYQDLGKKKKHWHCTHPRTAQCNATCHSEKWNATSEQFTTRSCHKRL